MKRVSIYRWECDKDEVVWRGPVEKECCWYCEEPGRRVCRIADFEWDDAAA